MIAELHIAARDCEALLDVVGQPVNVASSLAMSVIGLWLITLSRRSHQTLPPQSLSLIGFALILTGLGSVAFHGPGGWLAHVFHDTSITALPLAAAVALESERRGIKAFKWFCGLLAVAVVARMGVAESHYPVTVLAFGWFAFAAYKRRLTGVLQSSWLYIAGALLVIARVIFQLSRTGQALCWPHSLFQGHAIWHVLIAAAVVATARGLGLLPTNLTAVKPYASS